MNEERLNQINKMRENNAETATKMTELLDEPVSETQGLAVVAEPVYPVLHPQVVTVVERALALASLQVQAVMSVFDPAAEEDSAGQSPQVTAAPAAEVL